MRKKVHVQSGTAGISRCFCSLMAPHISVIAIVISMVIPNFGLAGGSSDGSPDGPPALARVLLVAQDMTEPGALALAETLGSLGSTKLTQWNIKINGPVSEKLVYEHVGGVVIRHFGDCAGTARLDDDELYLYEDYIGSRGNFILLGRNFAPAFYNTPFFKDELFTQIKGHDQFISSLEAPQSKVFAAADSFAVKGPNRCDTYDYMDLLLSSGPGGECVGTFGET